AGHVYGQAMSFMDVFDSDQSAEVRKDNLFDPFADRYDWEIGQWLLGSGLSMATIPSLGTSQNILLGTNHLNTLSLSFQSAKQLRGLVEMLPPGPQWKCKCIETSHPTKSKVYLYYWDPVDSLEAVFSNSLFHGFDLILPVRCEIP
ncbi:hypothetical protein BU15DRAFT_44875, partial [Melanogaster broomeanus]